MWFLQTPFLVILLLTAIILLIVLRRTCLNAIQYAFQLIRNAMYWNPVIVIYSVILFSYAISFPLSYDEAHTFNHFTSKSLTTILATYPQPNNHVFHSLLTWISWKLFHWVHGPEIVRLPALIASILSVQLIQHHFLKRSTLYGCLLLTLFIAISNYFQFSFQARGYAIHSFLAILSFIIIRQDTQAFQVRYFGFMLLCFIGLFTIPTYLFTAFALGTYWLANDYALFFKNIFNTILITLLFALLTFLAYTPIMLHEGVAALFSNQFVLSKGHVTILDVLKHSNTIVLSAFLPYPLAFLIPIAFIFFAIKRKQYPLLMLIVAPLFMMYALNQLPIFSRIFLPISALMSVITLHHLHSIYSMHDVKKKHLVLFSLLACFFIPLGLYHFEHTHKKDDFNTAFHLRKINRLAQENNEVTMYQVYWHLKVPIEAQNKISRNKKIRNRKEIPTQLPPNTLLISSIVLPQFESVDTFPLHNGVAYLYRRK